MHSADISRSTPISLPAVSASDRAILGALATPTDSLQVREYLLTALRERDEFIARTGLNPTSRVKDVSTASITPHEWQKFESWYQQGGSAEVRQFMLDLTSLIIGSGIQGHPGHDRRHILIKDPLAGLGIIAQSYKNEAQKIDGVKTLFLLPSLFHDIGRLPEAALNRADLDLESSVTREHAVIGFKIFQDCLRTPLLDRMPQTLKDHLAYAVLAHPGGEHPHHLITDLVQACDRAQIYGPEGILRMLASEVGRKGISIYPKKLDPGFPHDPKDYGGEDKNLLGHLEYFLRRGSNFPGRSELVKITGRFLWTAVSGDPEYATRYFEPELARQSGVRSKSTEPPLPPSLWKACHDEPSAAVQSELARVRREFSPDEVGKLAIAAVTAPGAADVFLSPAIGSNLTAGDIVLNAVSAVPPTLQAGLYEALAYGLAMRRITDRSDRALAIAHLSHPDPVVSETAKLVSRMLDI